MSESQFQPVEARSIFAGLFEMQFRTFITPRTPTLLYILLMVTIVIQFIVINVYFDDSPGIAIVIGIAYSFIVLVFARIAVETLVAFFAATADLRRLAAGMADDADDV